MAYQKAVSKLSSRLYGNKGGSGVTKRQLNKIYKKNTGRTTKGRNSSLKKYK